MRIGCDIISISCLAQIISDGGEEFVERVFTPSEYSGASLERLAGIFAAKEAACKALSLPAGRWQEICVFHDEAGAPHLSTPLASKAEVSISHDGDYAFAVVIAE